MANKKPKTIQIDTYTAGVFGRTEGYANKVRQLYADAVSELLKLSAKYNLEEGDVFDFDKMPKKMRDEAHKILRALYSAVYNEVQHGIMAEWQYANLSSDIIIKRVFGDKFAKNEQNHFARWFARNNEAMDAFLSRKENGFSLSQRIWKQTEQLKDEMALALSVSLGQGDSAATVSRKVRQYLQEPDRLFRHVRGADGKLRWSKAARAYHPGRGVYRSSYKNAMRLTRTETNMAYRTADSDRWQRLDFVLGQHIGRGHNKDNEPDICDKLAGDYPKEFKFTGWHPQCRCISTPILATPAEMAAMRKAMKEGKDPMSVLSPDRRVTEPPKAFTDWVSENRERIENASSVPYFIKDNFKDGDIDKGWRWEKSEEEKQAELEAYTKQVKHQELVTKMGNNVYNVATEYPEVDTSELVSAINASDYTAIEEQAKAVAHQISAINKKIAGMKDLIEDPKMWMKAYDFTSEEMLATHKAIADKIAEFKAKYAAKAGTIAMSEAEYVLDKLGWEINHLDLNKNDCQSKYKTWMVSKDAYVKQKTIYAETVFWEQQQAEVNKLTKSLSSTLYGSQITKALQGIIAKDKTAVQSAILELQQWKDVDDVLQEALTFKTKSQPYLNLIAKLQTQISAGELTKANSTVVEMKAKRAELAKAKASRLAKKQKNIDGEVVFGSECFTHERRNNAKWFIHANESTDYFFPQAQALWKVWTDEEKYGLWNYTAGSRYCTYTLRGWDGWCYETSARQGISDIKRDIPAITSALNKSILQEDCWLKRDDVEGITEKIFGLSDGFFKKFRTEIQAEETRLESTFGFNKRLKALQSCLDYKDLSYISGEAKLASIYDDYLKADTSTKRSRLFSNHAPTIMQLKKRLEDEQKEKLVEFATNKLKGRTGVDDSFGSCGNCKESYFGCKNVVWNIYCPAGTRAAYCEPFSDFGGMHEDGTYRPKLAWTGNSKPVASDGNENEVLMQRGTKYRITKVEWNENTRKWYIDVEVIAQNPRAIKEYKCDRRGECGPNGWYAVFE